MVGEDEKDEKQEKEQEHEEQEEEEEEENEKEEVAAFYIKKLASFSFAKILFSMYPLLLLV